MWELAETVLHSKLFWSTSLVFTIYLYLKLVTYNYFKKKHVPEEDSMIPFGSLFPVVVGQKCIGKTFEVCKINLN